MRFLSKIDLKSCLNEARDHGVIAIWAGHLLSSFINNKPSTSTTTLTSRLTHRHITSDSDPAVAFVNTWAISGISHINFHVTTPAQHVGIGGYSIIAILQLGNLLG
jgi:hypothetical protein